MSEPKPLDPTVADHVITDVITHLPALSALCENAFQKEKRFPDWKERQLRAFVRYLGLYAQDLRERYHANRIDTVAQAMRNLMELNVWIRYCELSREDGKRFFDDGYRDMRDMVETLQRLDTGSYKEPKKIVEDLLVELKTKAPAFDVTDYEADFLKVNDAAGKIGTQSRHSVYYKVASKFAHPTPMLFFGSERPDAEMLGAFYDAGVRIAAECFRDLEKIVRTAYADLIA